MLFLIVSFSEKDFHCRLTTPWWALDQSMWDAALPTSATQGSALPSAGWATQLAPPSLDPKAQPRKIFTPDIVA